MTLGPDASDKVRHYLTASRDVMTMALDDNDLISTTVAIAQCMEQSLRNGGKILLAGNGGSAADAQHIAGELLSRLYFDRAPLPAIALTTDSAVLTAIGNDYGYEDVFARQVSGLGRSGDVFVAISTSGRSPNILRAVEAAKANGLHTVAFTGNSNTPLAAMCAMALRAPTGSTPLIQQTYIAAAHVICELVERAMFEPKSDS
jgi:D-sedoheptulose 7-phosphate isomerase